MSSILSTPHIQQHFDVLARGLSRFAAIWQALPFRHRDIPWLESFPDLVTTLQGLGEDSLSHFEEDTDALVAFLEPFLPQKGGRRPCSLGQG
ncbi:MAG: hypothetical protein CL920_31680 [Deltaproteobacteria bacterium]|nr:hypothetical protein [Deltaproteobacteria bacterium]MBU53280.1 hypothetical protein [Deltaproteobacteria bacterium]|tara:strand:- start:148 stop:423 length:276 start_codon:yes stop_codon:yes gene_type:complete